MTHLKEYRQATEITSFFMFCIYLVSPVLAPYVKNLGLSDFQVSLMFALFPLTLILVSSNLGSLSDSIGRKKIIIFGIILEVLSIALYLLGVWYLVIIARFMEAVAFASVIFIGMARMQDNLESKTRGKYSGQALTLMQMGKLIAPAIGGFLADYWFIKAPFIFSMFALLIMLWMVAIKEPFNIRHHFSRSDFNMIRKMRMFFSDRRFRGMAILGMTMHASLPVTFVFIPIYIVEHFHLSYQYVGYALFAMGFFLLFQFYIGSYVDRFRKSSMILFGTCVFGLSIAALALAPNYWVFVCVLLVAGLGNAFWNVSAWAFMAGIGDDMKKQGFVIGSYVSVAKMGSLSSYIFGGMIVKYLGVQALMMVVGMVIIIGTLASCVLIRGKVGKGR